MVKESQRMYSDLPANIGEIKHRQADIILMVGDVDVLLKAQYFCITDVGSIKKGAQEQNG